MCVVVFGYPMVSRWVTSVAKVDTSSTWESPFELTK